MWLSVNEGTRFTCKILNKVRQLIVFNSSNILKTLIQEKNQQNAKGTKKC